MVHTGHATARPAPDRGTAGRTGIWAGAAGRAMWSSQAISARVLLMCSVAVASRWASADPKAAAAWVASFPQGSARDSGLQNVAVTWGSSDPTAAGQWLANLPR